MFIAVENGNPEIIQLLLNKKNIDINAKTIFENLDIQSILFNGEISNILFKFWSSISLI